MSKLLLISRHARTNMMLAKQMSPVYHHAARVSLRKFHRSVAAFEVQKPPSPTPSNPQSTPAANAHSHGHGEAGNQVEEFDPRKSQVKSKFDITTLPATIWNGSVWLAQGTWKIVREPKIISDWWVETKPKIVHELKHYWLGSKLLVADTKIAYRMVRRVTQGEQLTRRERRQLLRTVADLFRLVPFMFFVIVPFAEFSLPFFLKVFPNMLPSQFQEKLQEQEKIKQQLALRMDMAEFLNDTLETMAKSKESQVEGKELNSILELVRDGRPVTNEQILKVTKLFRDEITLDTIARPQLVSMCKYMGLSPYGPDVLLRMQLRRQLQSIEADDELIMKEGLHNLTIEEIKQACMERGMRASGVSDRQYRRHLEQWLDLSLKQDIPASLLILSRAFTLSERDSAQPQKVAEAVRATLLSLDEDALEDAMLESGHLVDREKVLEAKQRQAELIEEEREDIKEEEEKVVKEMIAQQKQEQAAAAVSDAGASVSAAVTPAAVAAVVSATAAAAAEASPTAPHHARVVAINVTASELHATKPDATIAAAAAAQPAAPAAPAVEAPKTADAVKKAAAEEAAAKADVVTPQQLKMISEALVVMASDSAVAKEKEKLAELKSELTHIQEDEQLQQDPNAKKMSERLAKMFNKLEKQIETAEVKIGTAMKVLDKDKDGVVSTEEIQSVVREYLKSGTSQKGAAKIAELLDSDHDQRVAVKILDKLAEDPDEEAEDKEKEKERLKDKEEKEKKAADGASKPSAAVAEQVSKTL